jgi:hypothetical protein
VKQSIRIPKAGPFRDAVAQRIVRYLSLLPADKEWKVTVDEYKKERSEPQNNSLFGVAYKAIREATGNDKDTLHNYFCGEYFGWVPVLDRPGTKPRRTTTTDEDGKRNVLTTTEFMDFYAFVQQKAAEVCGVYVPDPNEVVDG